MTIKELNEIKESYIDERKKELEEGVATVDVHMGTCGIAAGARDTMHAIINELHARDIEANIKTVGCIGMCAREPLVDIEQAGQPRVTYGNITADRVSRLIEEHLVNGRIVEEWVVGRLPS